MPRSSRDSKITGTRRRRGPSPSGPPVVVREGSFVPWKSGSRRVAGVVERVAEVRGMKPEIEIAAPTRDEWPGLPLSPGSSERTPQQAHHGAGRAAADRDAERVDAVWSACTRSQRTAAWASCWAARPAARRATRARWSSCRPEQPVVDRDGHVAALGEGLGHLDHRARSSSRRRRSRRRGRRPSPGAWSGCPRRLEHVQRQRLRVPVHPARCRRSDRRSRSGCEKIASR